MHFMHIRCTCCIKCQGSEGFEAGGPWGCKQKRLVLIGTRRRGMRLIIVAHSAAQSLASAYLLAELFVFAKGCQRCPARKWKTTAPLRLASRFNQDLAAHAIIVPFCADGRKKRERCNSFITQYDHGRTAASSSSSLFSF